MTGVRRLSIEEVMKVARERFIQFSSQNCDDHSMLGSVFGSAPFGLSCQETKDVELACLLLASAEKVGKKEFDQGSKLLNLCDFLSSKTGSSVQRTVHYFTKALQERIERETRRMTLEGSKSSEEQKSHQETMMYVDPALIVCFLHLPFYQIINFSGIQAIVDSVASAKKVHYIDLAIRSGGCCIVLMQALATRFECPIELLKVTAVGTTSKQEIEKTGKRLAHFAETLNMPFLFKIVMVRDFKDLNEDIFESKAGEVVAVYSPVMLNKMLMKPSFLESLIKVLRDLNPCVMVVTEVEADHNSPTFLGRFSEALLFYSAFFECLEVCMDQNDSNRMTLEATYFSREIRDIVATEGEYRTFRHMKIDAWRNYFERYSMEEQELSISSLHHAELLVKNFACGSSCTLDRNGKCLTVGWRGRPVLSLSAWKFQREKSRKRICRMFSESLIQQTP
ncbi:DELLA protein GAI1-like [Juglans microcarpa x Juglans regia]|uniref:DELLA protein GAI1-like n=1 Tax=Juglans microcarpa x Juglans regia TaxID=2249226 RepID=UPI001B7F1263|nr:DELLA protein GAI1-like [Juglans microcarpa x Juglans regia]